MGNSAATAYAALSLGDVDLRQGRCRKATSHLQQALALFREIGDRSGEAEALNGLGKVFFLTGQDDQARAQHAAALVLASQIGSNTSRPELADDGDDGLDPGRPAFW